MKKQKPVRSMNLFEEPTRPADPTPPKPTTERKPYPSPYLEGFCIKCQGPIYRGEMTMDSAAGSYHAEKCPPRKKKQ